MTSWAVVCNVWYLELQYIKPGETALEFAEGYVALNNSIRTISYFEIAFVKCKCSSAVLLCHKKKKKKKSVLMKAQGHNIC